MKNLAKIWMTLLMASALGCSGIDVTVDNQQDETENVPSPADEVTEALEAGNAVYGGLGSYWTVVKTPSGNFTMTRREARDSGVDGTVHGSYITLDSGFMEFTVTQGTGSFEDVPEGFTVHGIEVPNTLLIIKMPNQDRLLYMPAIGKCPTQSMTVNAILTHTQGTMDFNDRNVVHGIGEIDPAAGTIVGTGYFFEEGLNAHRVRDREAPYTCDRGELIVEGNEVTKDGVLTESGVGSIGGILMVPQDTGVSQADLAGDYVGVAYGPAESAGEREIKALTGSFGADGTSGTVRVVTNAEATAIESEHPISVSAPAEGAVPGSFLYSAVGDITETTRGLGVMLATRDIGGSGKTLIVAHGQRPADNRPYFMFLIEK